MKGREDGDDAYSPGNRLGSEYNVLTLDIGLGEDASSMYLHRVIANQVQNLIEGFREAR